MKHLVILMMAAGILACGTQKQLSKVYSGKSLSFIQEKFGEPKVVLENENEMVYVYEIIKELESTEVNQGKLTLDPIITPDVKKTMCYYFTFRDGAVNRVKYEEEYNR